MSEPIFQVVLAAARASRPTYQQACTLVTLVPSPCSSDGLRVLIYGLTATLCDNTGGHSS